MISISSKFFDSKYVKLLRSRGENYVLLYLKLLCIASENRGFLSLNDEVYLTNNMIAEITGEAEEVVEDCMSTLVSYGLLGFETLVGGRKCFTSLAMADLGIENWEGGY